MLRAPLPPLTRRGGVTPSFCMTEGGGPTAAARRAAARVLAGAAGVLVRAARALDAASGECGEVWAVFCVGQLDRGAEAGVETRGGNNTPTIGKTSRPSDAAVPPPHPPSLPDGVTYADAAGAEVPCAAVVAAVSAASRGTLLTNPHSDPSGAVATAAARARAALLSLVGAPPCDYVAILTPGATAALALVAASFPWEGGASRLTLTRDNHTSVLGLRASALEAGASVVVVDPVREAGGGWSLEAVAPTMTRGENASSPTPTTPCLLAWPLESNWSGARYDADLGGVVAGSTSGEWFTLLDAARGAATAPPDLSRLAHPPDFIILSAYKLTGAPSGVGALVASRRGAAALARRRRFFGGGAVDVASATADVAVLTPGRAGLEDGTPPLSSIVALPAALDALAGGGGSARSALAARGAAARAAAARAAAGLLALRHADGTPAVVVYCGYEGATEAGTASTGEDEPPAWRRGGPPRGSICQGPTLTFTILRPGGAAVGWRDVGRAALLARVHVRTGSLCNPGAAEAALGRTPADAAAAASAGAACGDGSGLDARGWPTGAVRASFGGGEADAAADAVVAMVKTWFVDVETPRLSLPAPTTTPATIASLHVYPLKSAAGFSPPSWPLRSGGGGLAFDRAWAAVDDSGRPLTARVAPALRSVTAVVDADTSTLTLTPPPGSPLAPLKVSVKNEDDAAPAASAWLTTALGVPARLARAPPTSRHGLANEADLLLVSEASMAALGERLSARRAAAGATGAAAFPPDAASVGRFRPNVVVSGPGLPPHAEDGWAGVTFVSRSDAHAAITTTVAGPCARCPSVNAAACTPGGPGARQPLLELASYRRRASGGGGGGGIDFGVLLTVEGGGVLGVGDGVVPVG